MVSRRGTKRTEKKGGLKTGRRQPSADAGTSSPAQGTELENSIRDKLSMFREQNKGQCVWGREGKGSVLQEEQGAKDRGSVKEESLDFLPSTMKNYQGSQLYQ